MPITLNGTTGITSDGGYTGDGLTVSDGAPAGAVTIDSAGNVGVGTNTPSTKLAVYGGASGVDTRVTIGNAAAGFQIGVDSSNNALLATNIANVMAFYTNNTERMRLDALGNLGVGTTSPTNRFESSVSGSGYWNNSNGWSSGSPSAVVITNSTNGGYDAALIGRMTDSGGTSKNSFAIGTVGTGLWTAGNNATQIADLYIAVRNNAGGITERARITSTGDFQFNSGYGSVATAFGCRAWVNFNGTGTVAIRASGNVTSITDNGTGDYTVNFTTAMVDANYSPCVTCASSVSAYAVPYDMNTSVYTARNTTSYRFNTLYSANNLGGGTVVDCTNIYVAIFR